MRFATLCAITFFKARGGADGVLVVDETGFVKKGERSAGLHVGLPAQQGGSGTAKQEFSGPVQAASDRR